VARRGPRGRRTASSLAGRAGGPRRRGRTGGPGAAAGGPGAWGEMGAGTGRRRGQWAAGTTTVRVRRGSTNIGEVAHHPQTGPVDSPPPPPGAPGVRSNLPLGLANFKRDPPPGVPARGPLGGTGRGRRGVRRAGAAAGSAPGRAAPMGRGTPWEGRGQGTTPGGTGTQTPTFRNTTVSGICSCIDRWRKPHGG